jgi:putative ABC transport system substrate-binding protein
MLHRSSPRLIVRDAGRSETIATGQIVKGVKPADLPVVQSTKFEFVINTRHDF